MMSYINLLQAFAALLPVIIDLVRTLESVGNTAGTGAEKLSLVLTAVKTAFERLQSSDVTWERLEPLVKVAVEGILKIIRK